MTEEVKDKMLCKIVYFDEDSVTDFVQIVAGGKLEKTTELLNESADSGKAGVEGSVSVGWGGFLKTLLGFESKVSVDAALETSFSTNQMAKNILKNTILTDFIDLLGEITEDEVFNNIIKCFKGFAVWAPEDSLSHVALISPYLSMLKGGTSVPAGDFNIALDKLDNTIRNAKGYYEFVGTKDKENVIFRFNIKSFKNNYKATDLLKMDISIYAIKVGKSSINKLNFNNELNINPSNARKDNPVYQKNSKADDKQDGDNIDRNIELDVYDVLLAGVEVNGK